MEGTQAMLSLGGADALEKSRSRAWSYEAPDGFAEQARRNAGRRPSRRTVAPPPRDANGTHLPDMGSGEAFREADPSTKKEEVDRYEASYRRAGADLPAVRGLVFF